MSKFKLRHRGGNRPTFGELLHEMVRDLFELSGIDGEQLLKLLDLLDQVLWGIVERA